MEIDHCVFPDDLLYDVENNIWLRINNDDSVTVGVTSVLSSLAGRLIRANLKPCNVVVEKGQSLGTLESERFVGPVPSPISGTIIETNSQIPIVPRTINDSPYERGWIARLRPSNLTTEAGQMRKPDSSKMLLAQKIAQLHVRCFKAFPDREMYEIGTECSAVLVHLNDQLRSMTMGEVMHLVSDDPTAYVEMVAWTDRSGQKLVDWRKEAKLFHFIVRKVR